MAQENRKSIFRKESLDRISSPEEYDQYLQVTGPGIWIVMCAIVLVLVGAILWSIMGRLDTTMEVAVVSRGDSVVCVLPMESAGKETSMKIAIADKVYDLVDAGRAPQKLTAEGPYAELLSCGFAEGTVLAFLDVDAMLPDGVYIGRIQVEQVAPISFIVN